MGKYDDIINLPRPISKTRKPMSIHDRSAQFAPFAALTGYEETIKETSRLTDSKIELSDEEKELINCKINYILDNKIDYPILIKYFVKDLKKNGGSYKAIEGVIKAIDEINKDIILKDKTRIEMENIISVSGDIFNILDNIE